MSRKDELNMSRKDELTGLARWEDRFSRPGYHFGTAPNRFLTDHAARLRPGMRALSIADGEGRNGVWLAEQGCRVTTVDFSATGQAKAQQLAAERGVEIETIQADITQWDWPEDAFDLVVGIFFQFLTPAERTVVFPRIGRALKSGGLLLIQGYGTDQLRYRTGGPGKLEHLYTEALLRDAFAGFASLEVRGHVAELAEGDGHVGTSALVDCIGVK